jgi:hypothetical protein
VKRSATVTVHYRSCARCAGRLECIVVVRERGGVVFVDKRSVSSVHGLSEPQVHLLVDTLSLFDMNADFIELPRKTGSIPLLRAFLMAFIMRMNV